MTVIKTGKVHLAGRLGAMAFGSCLAGVSCPEKSSSDRARAAVDENRSSTLGNHCSATLAAKKKRPDINSRRMTDMRGRSVIELLVSLTGLGICARTEF